MEFLNFVNTYWHVLGGVTLAIFGVIKFILEMIALKKRVATVETELQNNFKNDTESKNEVKDEIHGMKEQISGFKTQLTSFGKALKAILKKLDIPDMI